MRTSILAVLLGVVLLPLSAMADDLELRLKKLDAEVLRQAETISNQQKSIEEMKELLNTGKTAESPPAVDSSSKTSGFFGGSLMSNPYISVILDAKGYVSNLKNSQLEGRGVPGYTTEGGALRNNFNVDAAELLIFAPVDPYFNLYVNIPVTSDGAALEEAYFITTNLPEGLQVKGGRFKSNASRLNAQHPHAWDFAELPLTYRSFLGPEALGGENGVQLTWMPSLPVYTLLGFEALQGNNPLLFGDDGNWGAHAFTSFARVSFDTTENSSLYLSPWVMFGSTRTNLILPPDQTTGNSFDLRGNSTLYGMEAVWKWRSGHQKLTLQGEYLYLAQNGDLSEIDATGTTVNLEALKRHQDGAYIQAVYHLNRFGVGARYDRMEIFANTFERSGANQSFGSKPWRVSAMTEYNFTEFSRIRAQFNHDHSDRDGRINNQGILQITFAIGAHGAHPF
jgi:TonB-dependent receptor-like protein